MKTPSKAVLVTLSVIVLLALAVAVYALTRSASAPSTAETVRADSHVLDDGEEDAVTVVEFLDFECPSCGAFYPVVEDLREKYDGRITYVVRYFPLPGHVNSTQAALAAEAAAQQGRFEDMYDALFTTQAEWSMQLSEESPELFRAFAERLGLDMEAYDEAVADPATLERILSDKADGEALGVHSTPTFFVDGELLQLQTFGDLEAAIENALKG